MTKMPQKNILMMKMPQNPKYYLNDENATTFLLILPALKNIEMTKNATLFFLLTDVMMR
jgi:hypothetical protein